MLPRDAQRSQAHEHTHSTNLPTPGHTFGGLCQRASDNYLPVHVCHLGHFSSVAPGISSPPHGSFMIHCSAIATSKISMFCDSPYRVVLVALNMRPSCFSTAFVEMSPCWNRLSDTSLSTAAGTGLLPSASLNGSSLPPFSPPRLKTAFGSETPGPIINPLSPMRPIACPRGESSTRAVICSFDSSLSGAFRSRARSAHAPNTASATTSGTEATPTCVPVSHSRTAASPSQHPPKPASAASTATSHRLPTPTPSPLGSATALTPGTQLAVPNQGPRSIMNESNASGGNLGFQDGRHQSFEVRISRVKAWSSRHHRHRRSQADQARKSRSFVR